MFKPASISTFSESDSLSRDRSNFLIEGSRIFPPLRKLFRKFQSQPDGSTVTTLPSINEPTANFVRPFVKPDKNFFNGISSDVSPFDSVELSSCSYSYSPSVVAAGFKQRYWPTIGTSSSCNLVRSFHSIYLGWTVVSGQLYIWITYTVTLGRVIFR